MSDDAPEETTPNPVDRAYLLTKPIVPPSLLFVVDTVGVH